MIREVFNGPQPRFPHLDENKSHSTRDQPRRWAHEHCTTAKVIPHGGSAPGSLHPRRASGKEDISPLICLPTEAHLWGSYPLVSAGLDKVKRRLIQKNVVSGERGFHHTIREKHFTAKLRGLHEVQLFSAFRVSSTDTVFPCRP